MNTRLGFILATVILAGCATATSTSIAPQAQGGNAICMLRTSVPPSVKVTVLGAVNGSKEFYGSVTEILPLMADEARKLGADAIVNLETHQRVGLWAWAHPVGTGTAVKLDNKSDLNCVALGGSLY